MTKCFLSGKTYPDYEPTDADQREDFQRELYKAIGSWGDFVNHEQTQLAVQCAKLIVNLNNNNPEAFKTVLSSINMMVQDDYFEPDDVCRNGKPIADCECC